MGSQSERASEREEASHRNSRSSGGSCENLLSAPDVGVVLVNSGEVRSEVCADRYRSGPNLSEPSDLARVCSRRRTHSRRGPLPVRPTEVGVLRVWMVVWKITESRPPPSPPNNCKKNEAHPINVRPVPIDRSTKKKMASDYTGSSSAPIDRPPNPLRNPAGSEPLSPILSRPCCDWPEPQRGEQSRGRPPFGVNSQSQKWVTRRPRTIASPPTRNICSTARLNTRGERGGQPLL